MQELLRCADLQGLGADALRQATLAFAQRLRIADVYKPATQFDGPVTLIKCSEKMMRNLGEFYELDKVKLIFSLSIFGQRYGTRPPIPTTVRLPFHFQVCSRKDWIRTVTVPGNHEGFVLGESARVTAGHFNDALFGAGRS